MRTTPKVAGGLAALAVAGLVAACGTTTEAEKPSTPATIRGDASPPKAEAGETKATKPKATITSSQARAIESAKDYLSFQAFSKKGLIQQLSSDAGEGYPRADAVFAVDHMNIDWKEQAVKSARGYLDMQSFSRQGLIHQLSSDAGEGFTLSQAKYAVGKVY
jgi:hypothetical protein